VSRKTVELVVEHGTETVEGHRLLADWSSSPCPVFIAKQAFSEVGYIIPKAVRVLSRFCSLWFLCLFARWGKARYKTSL